MKTSPGGCYWFPSASVVHERYINNEFFKSFHEHILIGSIHYQIDAARQFLKLFGQTFSMFTARARLYYLPEDLPVPILVRANETEERLAAFNFVITTQVLV